MLKTNYESNACLLLETDLRWLLWRLGLLLRALKSGLWPVMNVEEFTLKFDEFLNKLNPSKYDMYVMGDVNIGLLRFHSH